MLKFYDTAHPTLFPHHNNQNVGASSHTAVQVFDEINPDNQQPGQRGEGAEPIKRAVKEAFQLPHRKLDSSVTDGDSSVWQTYRRAEPGERPGTGSGAGILVEKWLAPGAGWPLQQQERVITHKHTLCHTPVEEQTEAGREGRP